MSRIDAVGRSVDGWNQPIIATLDSPTVCVRMCPTPWCVLCSIALLLNVQAPNPTPRQSGARVVTLEFGSQSRRAGVCYRRSLLDRSIQRSRLSEQRKEHLLLLTSSVSAIDDRSMMGGEPSQPPCLGGRRRRRRRRSLLPHALLLGIVGTLMLAVLASTADAWRLPSFAHRRPAPQLQLQQQRPKTQLLWAAGPSTQEPPPATDKKEGGGDGNAKQQQGAGGDDGPMDAVRFV